MRQLEIVFIVLFVAAVAAPTPAVLLDMVDIGNPADELTHNIAGWGDIQCGTLHDPPGPYGLVDVCRGVDCPEALGDGDIWAWVTLDFGPECCTEPRYVSLRHLEGQAVDAFDLYIYAVGEAPPSEPVSTSDFNRFIDEIDGLLRKEHTEDYCGIVYVDDPNDPSFIKIYDPNNLGMVCGSSGAPPPYPGWILTLIPPENLDEALTPAGNRRRWWQRLFA